MNTKIFQSRFGDKVSYLYWQKLFFNVSVLGVRFYCEKHSGFYLPLFTISVGENLIGFKLFHSGAGIWLFFPKLFIIQIATTGQICWSMKKGLFRFRILNSKFYEY